MKRALPILLWMVLLLSTSGCRFARPERKIEAQLHSQKDIAVTQEQVRLRMRALVDPMCGELEQAADQIIAAATAADVRRAALLWKMEGVPALREALFQPGPYAAVMDTWVLCHQMADYFESGPGQAALAESAPQAVTACRGLEEKIAQVAASMSISGDVSKARVFAKQWAARHPIRHSISDRESTLSRVTERDAAGSMSATEAVAEITTTVDDLNRRLEVYSDQLFRQARWEADLFKTDLLRDLSLDGALPLAERAVQSAEQAAATVDRLVPVAERAVSVAEGAPKLVASEREAAIKAVQNELTRTIKFVQEERMAALEHLTKERLAAIQELQRTVVQERKALTAEIEQVGLKLVDHAMWRVTQLVAVSLAGVWCAGVVSLFLVRWIFFGRTLGSRNGHAAG